MAASDQTVVRHEDVYVQLLVLTSWTEEEKIHLVDLITEWTTAFEQQAPAKLSTNMHHLLELLSHNAAIVPLVPVETIFTVIQSVDIPSEVWLDCLLAVVIAFV